MEPSLPVHEELMKAFNDRNLPKVVEMAGPLAEKGDPFGCYIMGLLYSPYSSWAKVEKNSEKALNYLEFAASRGSSMSARLMGDMHEEGFGVPRNPELAFKCYEKGAMLGEANSLGALGRFYKDGKVVKRNYEKAMQYFEQAANKGHLVSQTNIALMLFRGQGVKQDLQSGMIWARRAADAGEAISQQVVGQAYEAGDASTKRDLPEAWKYLSLSSAGSSVMSAAEKAAVAAALQRVQSKMNPAQMAEGKKRLAAWKKSPKWKFEENRKLEVNRKLKEKLQPAASNNYGEDPSTWPTEEKPMSVDEVQVLMLKDYF
jgi:hypothetical protein